MITLKKLVAKEWLNAFLASLAILMLLVAVANVVSELLRGVTTLTDILINFLLDIPRWMGQIFPLATMMATLFSLNKLQRRSELMAMLSLGFSRFQIICTIALMAFVCATAQFAISAFIRPITQSLKKTWLREGGIYFRQGIPQNAADSVSSSGRLWYKNDSYFNAFEAFDKKTNTLHNMATYYFDNGHHIVKIIQSKKAAFKEKNQWKLYKTRQFLHLNERNLFPKVFLVESQFITLKESASDFQGLDANLAELPLLPLYDYIRRIDKLGIRTSEYEMMLYDKVTMSLISLFFSLLPMSALFNPQRRHSSFGKNILYVLVFTSFFWPIYSFFQVLGSDSHLPPLLAALMVPLLCILYLSFYFYRNRRFPG